MLPRWLPARRAKNPRRSSFSHVSLLPRLKSTLVAYGTTHNNDLLHFANLLMLHGGAEYSPAVPDLRVYAESRKVFYDGCLPLSCTARRTGTTAATTATAASRKGRYAAEHYCAHSDASASASAVEMFGCRLQTNGERYDGGLAYIQ
jgi:hypothetical protein